MRFNKKKKIDPQIPSCDQKKTIKDTSFLI